jgi:hypothetical protein
MGKSAPLRKRRVGPTSARFGEEKLLATIAADSILTQFLFVAPLIFISLFKFKLGKASFS